MVSQNLIMTVPAFGRTKRYAVPRLSQPVLLRPYDCLPDVVYGWIVLRRELLNERPERVPRHFDKQCGLSE